MSGRLRIHSEKEEILEKVRENLGISLPSTRPGTLKGSKTYDWAGHIGDELASRRQANKDQEVMKEDPGI